MSKTIILPESRPITDFDTAMPDHYELWNPPTEVEKIAREAMAAYRALPQEHRSDNVEDDMEMAEKIVADEDLPLRTLKKMKAFFDSHVKDKRRMMRHPSVPESFPNKPLQTWMMWGGDEGRRWVEKQLAEYRLAKSKKK